MIDLAIVGMGRWGLTLVESVQGKSDRVRFTHLVTRSPDRVSRSIAEGRTVAAPMDIAA